jgi:hypothetical protein
MNLREEGCDDVNWLFSGSRQETMADFSNSGVCFFMKRLS